VPEGEKKNLRKKEEIFKREKKRKGREGGKKLMQPH